MHVLLNHICDDYLRPILLHSFHFFIKGKWLGFIVILITTVLYAIFEWYHLDTEWRPNLAAAFTCSQEASRSRSTLVRLLTRGYIAVFTLPDFRTTKQVIMI